eukprot:TRINITY_DN1573_c4_g1_i1.p1 TRINITY_DN1573_c4_g1~~TRINITY_DN1573_c4_g1_i1.p1  ORF type:complete len:289 (-),score=68.56 TRINITY_DN1573_c4_g1_i1:179-1045(-)
MKMGMKWLMKLALHVLLLQLLFLSTDALKLDEGSTRSELDLFTTESVIFELAKLQGQSSDVTARIKDESSNVLQTQETKSTFKTSQKTVKAKISAVDLLEKLYTTFSTSTLKKTGKDIVTVKQLWELSQLKGYTGSVSTFAKARGLDENAPVPLEKFKEIAPQILPGLFDLIYNQLVTKEEPKLTPVRLFALGEIQGWKYSQNKFVAALADVRDGLVPASLLETDGKGPITREEFQMLMQSRHPQARALWPNYHTQDAAGHKSMMAALKMQHKSMVTGAVYDYHTQRA